MDTSRLDSKRVNYKRGEEEITLGTFWQHPQTGMYDCIIKWKSGEYLNNPFEFSINPDFSENQVQSVIHAVALSSSTPEEAIKYERERNKEKPAS